MITESFGAWVGIYGLKGYENHIAYSIINPITKDNEIVARLYNKAKSVDVYDTEDNFLGSFDNQERATEYMEVYCSLIGPDLEEIPNNTRKRRMKSVS